MNDDEISIRKFFIDHNGSDANFRGKFSPCIVYSHKSILNVEFKNNSVSFVLDSCVMHRIFDRNSSRYQHVIFGNTIATIE